MTLPLDRELKSIRSGARKAHIEFGFLKFSQENYSTIYSTVNATDGHWCLVACTKQFFLNAPIPMKSATMVNF